MRFSNTLQKLGVGQAINYLYKGPEPDLRKLVDWADKFSGGEFFSRRKVVREAIEDPEPPITRSTST